MSGYRDVEWNMKPNETTGHYSYEQAQLAVLMDIRMELRRLNQLFRCSNFLDIPNILRRISRNTHKPKKRMVRKVKVAQP